MKTTNEIRGGSMTFIVGHRYQAKRRAIGKVTGRVVALKNDVFECRIEEGVKRLVKVLRNGCETSWHVCQYSRADFRFYRGHVR